MLAFDQPWLFGLLLVPVVLHFLSPAYREGRQGVRAPFLHRVAVLLNVEPTAGAVIPKQFLAQRIFVLLTWLLLVLAAVRPQLVGEPIVKTVPTRDLLLAVDLSGSMETMDFKQPDGEAVSRLAATKTVLDEFLARRKGDRVGLILFGSAAFVQAPFTEDLEVCRSLLDEARVGMAGPRTAVGDSIGLALTVFEDSELEERVLIVLTDGNDTSSTVPPRDAARIAKDRGITIHAVAIGDATAVGEDALDTETLRDVAESTGGRMFLGADRAELEAIYEELDRIETRSTESLSHRPKDDLFQWPLAAALLLSMLYHLWLALSLRRNRARRHVS